MNSIRLNRVKIPKLFKESGVSTKKVNQKTKLIQQGRTFVITLNDENTIVDGYASYIAYKNLGYKYIQFIRQGHHTRRENILIKADGVCYICGRKLSFNELTVDHMKPKAIGGTDDESNLRCCCNLCNNLKGQLSYSNELRAIIRRELVMRGIQVV